jgi:hypothetical protein
MTAAASLKTILLSSAFAAVMATPALAQASYDSNLLDILVAKKIITKTEAAKLRLEAAARPAPAAPVAAPAPTPAATPAGGVQGDIQTIPYIPDTVKRQLKDELRAEMVTKAEAEGWASPHEVAPWTKRITITGDVRVRGEGIWLPHPQLDGTGAVVAGNDPNIVNFNAINTGTPYNINRAVAGSPNPPYINSTMNRMRPRIRARLGVDAHIDDWISAQVRLATGNDNNPVTTNQTLGGGTGDFAKYAIWLDRANIQLTPHWGLLEGLKINAGRFENPFYTTELLFDNDLNFDGVSASYRREVLDGFQPFLTLGAFPVYNTDLNFGSRDAGAFGRHDKWLFAGQIGGQFQPIDAVKFTAAAGYFNFDGIQGKTSSPCLFSQDVCDTDNTRPLFQQYGNSLSPIRNIIADPTALPGLSPEPQYFGLASKFHVLDVHAGLDLNFFENFGARFEGDYVQNLAFDKAAVQAVQVNVPVGTYNPGGEGWYANLILGKPDVAHFGDWNFSVGYKHLESDAVVDGFTDSDFHLGGTNAKGYVLGAAFGIGNGTNISVRYLSADEITGQPYANDILQLDLNAKF